MVKDRTPRSKDNNNNVKVPMLVKTSITIARIPTEINSNAIAQMSCDIVRKNVRTTVTYQVRIDHSNTSSTLGNTSIHGMNDGTATAITTQ
jgi:hypothetical protein